MKDSVKLWLRRFLLVFGVVCMLVTLYRTIEGAGGEESYDHASQIAFRQETLPPQQTGPQETAPPETTQPMRFFHWVPEPVTEEDAYMQRLAEVDLDALRQVNPDVIGWLFVPNTNIDYPILQGEDNDFYLKHTWEKVRNSVGAIFMECRNYPDFADFNTILYGHNMGNGSMFADLDKHRDERYWAENPYIYVANDAGIFRYEVFSYHRASVDSFVYGVSFNQKETRDNFIASALESAEDDLGIVPAYTDRILSLSTCNGTYGSRWVVHARLKMILTEKIKDGNG